MKDDSSSGIEKCSFLITTHVQLSGSVTESDTMPMRSACFIFFFYFKPEHISLRIY